MTCLPCEKEAVDNGMGKIAAQFYADVESGMPLTAAAATFYANGVKEIFSPLAARLLAEKGRLNKSESQSLNERIDLQCYRADTFVAWGRMPKEKRDEHAAAWVEQIFAWAKDDQTFYTKLATDPQHDKGATA